MGIQVLLADTLTSSNTTTTVIMSWQSYVDDQLISTKMIKNAVIAGHDGNIWAHSAGFPVSVEELKTLLARYADTDKLAMNGVTVGGTKYMFLSATDRVVRGKKGTSGVHCIKTVQALIVCVYGTPWYRSRLQQLRKSWASTSSLWATEGLLSVVISTCDISSNIFRIWNLTTHNDLHRLL